MKIGKKLLLILFGIMFLAPVAAYSYSVDAVVTADNHYALYYGNDDGSVLSFVGKNEANQDLGGGVYSWSNAENWSFDVNGGDYIYVVGWSDDQVGQGWLGQFTSAFGTFYSNENDWDFYATGQDLDSGYDWTDATDGSGLATNIGNASWSAVTDSVSHGDRPWGTVTGIDAAADWIWGGSLQPGANHGEYLIFRTKMAEVPEPATMLLFGIGLVGLAGYSRNRNRKN